MATMMTLTPSLVEPPKQAPTPAGPQSPVLSSAERTQLEYAAMAEEYAESKKQPWRVEVEEHSLRTRLQEHARGIEARKGAPLKGLDLACGHGHYTRKLVQEWGCSQTACGVDISAEMVELAGQSTPAELAGAVRFLEADASKGDAFFAQDQDGAPFDFCIAAYLLNYADSMETLVAMLRTVRANLHPAWGVFLTTNDGPLDRPANYGRTERYGFVKETRVTKRAGPGGDAPLPDFAPLTYRIFHEVGNPAAGSFTFTNYYISPETLGRAFKEAGFSSFRLIPLTAARSQEHFQEFLEIGPVALMEAHV